MYIALAPFQLREGVSEDTLLTASDRFEEELASGQDGVIRRVLVRDGDGSGYGDLVFFRDEAALAQVIEAEQDSEACVAYFSIMESDGSHRVYEVVKSYE
ncbi:hypothetical protein [Streptomyces heilongjiangensis]|uniref:ABM domain-containing protein n=1 Tax=Streptomyces heilongjiangensis TaxID=945052 RepID=A0ABW1BHD1_9ACTN|nr:hypothetical protein [Streptomyces heilongjiangensis]MDC2952645.1 hypothetical protein [Streptomyces heilongjiangensis]